MNDQFNKQDLLGAERRQFIRLDHIFPVEFALVDKKGNLISNWYQGFTQDISKGGICLIVNQVKPEEIGLFAGENARIRLNIHIPFKGKGVEAVAKFVWLKNLREEPMLQYAIGLSYESISEQDNKKILKYIKTRRFLRILAGGFSLFLSIGLVVTGFYNATLRYENEKLISDLSKGLESQRRLEDASRRLQEQIMRMSDIISESGVKVSELQGRLAAARKQDSDSVNTLQASIVLLQKERVRLEGELRSLQEKKAGVDIQLETKEASLLEDRIQEKLNLWLRRHQNKKTGLVTSFEGDDNLVDWAFTYDQALAAMVFVSSGQPQRAREIFSFYKNAQRLDGGGFANAYFASSGDVSEYVAHAGPNIWLGLAVLQYTYQTKDAQYLDIALSVADWLEFLKDSEGGVMGGRYLSWYSTEHNLDLFAFYGMLYELTKQPSYKIMQQQTLNWLKDNAYSSVMSPAVKRGKGDSTIATDTFAWSVTALGPEVLESVGMDACGILDFAVSNCSVKVKFNRPFGGSAFVEGFDFAKHQNLARGGVVSCEWTSQMILAFKIMGDYYDNKGLKEEASHYYELADHYTAELSKMIITSSSPVGQGEFCLPYASAEFADTGHGWRTPRGSKTGSVAATAYTILALEGYNPLMFNERR